MRFAVFVCCFPAFLVSFVVSSPFEERLKEAFCASVLQLKNPQDTCYAQKPSNCSNDGVHGILVKRSLEAPRLVCKTPAPYFLWNKQNISSSFMEYKLRNSKNKSYTQPTRCDWISISNLLPNSTYEVQRWETTVLGHIDFRYQSSEMIIVTTSEEVASLLPVSDFKVTLNLAGNSYEAVVEWTPGKDFPCQYRLDAFSITDGKHFTETIDLRLPAYPPKTESRYKMGNLEFGQTYNITLRAFTQNPYIESTPSYSIIDIPSCLDTYANLTICEPPAPENVTYSEKCQQQYCTVRISWSSPKLVPDEYLILLYNVSSDEVVANKTTPGAATSAVIDGIKVGTYDMLVRAASKAGPGESTYKAITFMASTLDTTNTTPVVIVAVCSSLILLIVILVLLKKKRASNFDSRINDLYSKELFKFSVAEKPSVNQEPDEWEVDLADVTIESVLGEGAFGIVRKGILRKKNGELVDVGIKMLKAHASADEVRQLYQEIIIMKSVGTHRNLVSMIGFATTSDGPLLLVEFCSKGDLQTYLRKEWNRLVHFYRNEDGNENSVSNKGYVLGDAEDLLTPNDLISFARQVALGMEHLSRLRVIHRDLATRNVLLCSDNLVKVSDFGLSRDVYQSDVYCKMTGGKLPLRWMAPESITHQLYTTQSDVWSFGILLWEIVTLGEHPYPGVGNTELLGYLKAGGRMMKPANCGEELYEIMLSCWKENPKDRPTFTKIKNQLEGLLEDAMSYVTVTDICS